MGLSETAASGQGSAALTLTLSQRERGPELIAPLPERGDKTLRAFLTGEERDLNGPTV
jgi:hypothetical protein